MVDRMPEPPDFSARWTRLLEGPPLSVEIVEIPHVHMNAKQVADLQAKVVSIVEHLEWTSYGPSGDEEARKRPLPELDTDHLEAILITQTGISPVYKAAILHILKDRYLAMGALTS